MRILYIEDEKYLADAVIHVLDKSGISVEWAADGESGLELAMKPIYDAIVLDVMLPGLDGASIVRIMHEDEILSSTPVIVTSALRESERLFVPFPQVKGFCSKPFALKELVEKVKRAIGDELN